MAKTKEEEEAEKLAAAAKKPYTAGEIAGKVGSFFSEAASGPTSNYIKRQEREKREAGQDNTGRAAATAAAVGSAVSRGVSAAGSAIADKAQGPVTADNITGGSGTASVFGGVISKPTSGNGGGQSETAEVGPSSEAGKKAFEIERVGMYQQSKANQAALNQPLSKEAQGVMDLLASRRLDADLQGKSTELAGGVAQKDFSFGSAVDDVVGAADNGKFTPSPIEGAAEFDKEFGELRKSLGRPEEGETADQYQGRLKERSAARNKLQSQRPYDSVLAGTFKNENRSDLPTIAIQKAEPSQESPASPQASSSARATASKAPTVIQDPQKRLQGRQAFGAELKSKLQQSGGSYTFDEEDQKKATALGIGKKELGNFSKWLGRG